MYVLGSMGSSHVTTVMHVYTRTYERLGAVIVVTKFYDSSCIFSFLLSSNYMRHACTCYIHESCIYMLHTCLYWEVGRGANAVL